MPFCCSLVVQLLLLGKCNLVFTGLWRHMLLWKARCCSLLEAHSFVWGRNDLFFLSGEKLSSKHNRKVIYQFYVDFDIMKKDNAIMSNLPSSTNMKSKYMPQVLSSSFQQARWPFMLYLVLYVSVIDSPSFSNYSIMTNNEALSFRKYTFPRPSIP